MIPVVRGVGKRPAVAAGGSTPGDYPTSLTSWHKADAITGFANGASLTSWLDSSAAGNTATATLAPTYRTGVAKGGTLPVVRFVGGGGVFMSSNTPAGNPEQTIIAVVRMASSGGYRGLRCSNGNGGLYVRFEPAGKPEMVKNAVALIGTSTVSMGTSAFRVVSFTFSDSADTYAMTIDGSPAGSGTFASSLTSGLTSQIGQYSGGSDYLDGDVGEIATWDRVLTGTELSDVTAGLLSKWT